ncbi:potassium channel family protein [Undibacterium sp. Di24W]|uniref:potassium channel family protein n=1 Tax=Undibacterium sp. Di24W TaxID=3413033 RepID=UPI003BF065E9
MDKSNSKLQSVREHRSEWTHFSWFARPVLLLGLLLSIPAFYLLLVYENLDAQRVGRVLYGVVALILIADTAWQWIRHRHQVRKHGKFILDVVIIIGCIFSVFPSPAHWSTFEWLIRLSLCAVILLRISTLLLSNMRPSHLAQMTALALIMLSSAGAGFYWLEPNVTNYPDGVWLAFTTVATVGYGDIVPSTPASKIFAFFIVLLGYAMFSFVTANIAALFVGEEEEIFEQELHNDIRALHQEVAALREELRRRDVPKPEGLTLPDSDIVVIHK